jgi:hypothetical protein
MRLKRTVINWYTLLVSIGNDFNQLLENKGTLKHTGHFVSSLIFMFHLTLLFSYAAPPIVWSLNPKEFVFNELLISSGFMSAVTAIVLTVIPPAQQQERIYFKNNSALTISSRLVLSLVLPLLLLILLDHLVRVAL